ncbi:DUF1361 domain-containing protein [Paenibacillus sp. LK1]|uniref:DUF1361 domain-containing protein n=1 Tax=Paenibacillus sp. LK1 TaxID=2053014 RepID=UPI000C176A18|nr:DUF1361 domain-containing protein [Paenibacillus sp. LK1]PIH58513.1 hypothetical protein CS562_15350 [Paenibacillus sp. LK1]
MKSMIRLSGTALAYHQGKGNRNEEMNNNKNTIYLKMSSVLIVATIGCLLVAVYLRTKSNTNMYQFLTWDIFLAWVPFIISSTISYISNKKLTRSSIALVGVMCAGWLFFLPNSAYLFTEILHAFRYFDPQGETKFWVNIDFWYSLSLTFVLAILGLLLSICSIHQIHKLLNKRLNPFSGMVVVGVVLLLSSLGVYIGRFNRWNSWDVLKQPGLILKDIMTDLNAGNSILVEFVAMVFVIQVLGYITLRILMGKSNNI